MNKILTILFLLFISGVTFAQNSTLKFKTSKRISVEIYYPIDLFYNDYVYDQIEIYPDVISEYKVNVDGFCYIKIRYSDNTTHNLIVTGGNNLGIEYNEKEILFSGVDGVANRFNRENHTGEYAFIWWFPFFGQFFSKLF